MTTKLQEIIRAQTQQEIADRHNGLRIQQPSRWVIHTLRRRLSPRQIAIANDFMDLYATGSQIAPANLDRVDCGNGQAAKQDAAIDAQRELEGYAAAIRRRWGFGRPGDRGSATVYTIAQGGDLEDLYRVLGYARGSYDTVVRFVQITMQHAEDYDDERLTDKSNQGTKKAVLKFAPARSP